MQRMDSWLASDTDALQLGARFGAPGGRALPLLLNHVCICVIRVIRGEVLLRREGGDDFRHEFHQWSQSSQRIDATVRVGSCEFV